MVGSPLYIECAVDIVREVEVESSSIMISWSGPNISNIINDSRVSVTPTTASGATYTSNLQFIYLMEGDEGTYTCNVIISEISGLQSVALSSLISKLYFHLFYCITGLYLSYSSFSYCKSECHQPSKGGSATNNAM